MNLSKPKLLLADDSATIRKVVEMTFADEGIDVSSVADGASAMQKFVEIQPDIVLVDASLAGTDGYEICRMIKQDEATRHIPVLLLVGSFEPFDHDAAENAGVDGFITKPFHSIRDLVARVQDLLTGGEVKPVESSAKTPETEDIDSLYHKSFDGTQKIEDLETVDELLLDLGNSDEPEREAEPDVEPPMVEEVDELLGDTGMDDELIQTVSPAAEKNGNGSASPDGAAQAIKAFDWSPGAIIRAKPERKRPVRLKDEEQEAPEAPSDELVEQVAKLVIDKLSEQVIRDIAKEAVPRIAEKLIREALDNEGKT